MSFNRENTNPKTLQAIKDNSPNNQSIYSCNPGAVGLRGWQPPQAHMFVSTSAGNGFSAVNSNPPTETFPTTTLAHDTDGTGPPDLRRKNTVTSSPLKVRKTRENLRQGYIQDTNRSSPTPKLTNRKDAKVRAPLESTTDQRPSLDSGSVNSRPSKEQTFSNGFPLELNNAADSPLPVQPTLRKRSVRKMVVSKVKDGLLGRSRSASKMPVSIQQDTAISRTSSEYKMTDYNVAKESFQTLREDVACATRSSTFHSVQELALQEPYEEQLLVIQPKKPAALVYDTRNIPVESLESLPDTLQSAHETLSPSPEKTPRAEKIRGRFKAGSVEQPNNSGMLHICLSVIPASTALDLADDSTVWAIIEARATISTKSALDNPVDPDPGLLPSMDVVIIIDNSPFASPAALKSMSDIVQQICGLLKSSRDRLAVFCTYCPHDSLRAGTTSGCQIHRLQIPNVKFLMPELEKIETNPPIRISAVAEMNKMLREAVLSVVAVDGTASSDYKGGMQMFVLSPLPQLITDTIRKLVDWPIQQIRVGSCHQNPPSPVRNHTDGWSVEWNTATKPILEEMICQARKTSRNGILSHVKVSINPTSPCRVEKLLTPPRKSTLQLGQCITLFAKVNIPSIGYDSEAPANTPDQLLENLTKALGGYKSELFKAEVQYRHSLFPKGTELRTETACVIQRTNRNSAWGDARPTEPRGGLEVETEKARFIAKNYAPDLAVKILQKKFGNLWLEDSHSSELYRLREELEFQKKVLAEVKEEESKVSDTKTENSEKSDQSSSSKKRTTLHLCDISPSQIFNFRETPAPRAHSSSTQDEARKIWRHMRRNSRTNALLSSSEPNSRNASETVRRRGSQESVIERLAERDERLRELRLQALRNKRSVGAETLREFGEMGWGREVDGVEKEREMETGGWV